MTAWTDSELQAIGDAEEWTIRTMRRDGSLRDPFPVWGVRVGNGLYIRAVRGRTSPWFRGMQARHAGHVAAASLDRDIAFVDADADTPHDEIDAAYRAKYRRYPSIVPRCVTGEARSATLRLMPCETGHVE